MGAHVLPLEIDVGAENHGSLNISMSDKVKPFYSVVICVNPKGQVLMGLRLEDGIWTTPAGGSEGDESPIDCAIREIFEEALLNVVPNQLEPLVVKTARNGRKVHCFLYRCKQQYTSPELDPDKEVKVWKWIDPINFPSEFFDQKHTERRETILHALKRFYSLENMVENASDAQLTAISKSEKTIQVYLKVDALTEKLQTLSLVQKLTI